MQSEPCQEGIQVRLRLELREAHREIRAQAAQSRLAATCQRDCASPSIDPALLADPDARRSATAKLKTKIYTAMASKAKLVSWIVDSGASQHTRENGLQAVQLSFACVFGSRACLDAV